MLATQATERRWVNLASTRVSRTDEIDVTPPNTVDQPKSTAWCGAGVQTLRESERVD
jgi:hypothetical protein